MKLALVSLFLLSTLAITLGCGTFGQGSCDVNGNEVRPAGPNVTATYCNTGFCDCCPAALTCNQLLAGCGQRSYDYSNPITFTPSVSAQYYLNQPITPSIVTPNLIGTFCVNPSLPNGLSISLVNGQWVFSGTPTELVPPVTYTIVTLGGAGYVAKTTINFSVNICVPPPPPSSCTFGQMTCAGQTQYITCVQTGGGGTVYGPAQDCPPSTFCHNVGTYISCY